MNDRLDLSIVRQVKNTLYLFSQSYKEKFPYLLPNTSSINLFSCLNDNVEGSRRLSVLFHYKYLHFINALYCRNDYGQCAEV